VELVADHVVSVKEGGDNSMDNLVTACRKCNGGKGAKSLRDSPTSKEVIERIRSRTGNLHDQAVAIQEACEADEQLKQEAVNLKCLSYGVESIRISSAEKNTIVSLCKEYGADEVLDWYCIAASRGIDPHHALKYVYGIIRTKKESGEL